MSGTAFDAPAATKKSRISLPDGTEHVVLSQFSTAVRYARQATGRFKDGDGNEKPGEHEPFAVFETENGRVAIGDEILRNSVIVEIKD